MSISPTAEGFRAAFRRPSLTLAEISWRWTAGATAAVLLLFGLIEYLGTLPVTNGELLFLRTRHPYFVGEAIAHILRGRLNRVVIAGMFATWMLGLLWIAAASLGRIATVRGLLDYFRRDVAGNVSASVPANDGERDVVGSTEDARHGSMRSLTRLNFLRVALALAALLGLVAASILASFVSPDASPRPGLAVFLFLPLAALVCLVWWALNWLLSLAGMFAVLDGEDAMSAISAAVAFCRERTGALFAVSIWTGLAHLVAFVIATTVISVPLGLVAVVPWRPVVVVMGLVTIMYFALADWIYMARLAGYVCIVEMPEAVPSSLPLASHPGPPSEGATLGPPIQTSIDRNELILSDVPAPLSRRSSLRLGRQQQR